MPAPRSLSPIETDARALFDAAVRRVQADRLIGESDPEAWAPRPSHEYGQIRVAGMGKAAMAMAGVLEAEHPNLVDGGVVVVPDGYPDHYPNRLPPPAAIRVMVGGHPLPTEGSVRAGRRLLEQAQAVGEGDLLLVLVSGGGTALSTVPVGALDLPDLKTTYHRLLTAGVPIQPANAVRKHLTTVGGGQLAQAAHPADVGALVVSDVVGNDLGTIASGPTVPDPSTYQDAMQVLYRHGLWHEVPGSIREHLAAGARGKRAETPDDGAACFDGSRTSLLGTNETALEAARLAAEDRGYAVRTIATGVEGEARTVGSAHVDEMGALAVDEPTCWLWGGETTVTVTGDGTGGRNQEVALSAALALEDHDASLVLLSGGTDGIDGPTDAAGAWATPATTEAARAHGLAPRDHLERNDAFPLLDAIGHLLRPGPTHTNVMDIHVGLARPSS